MLPLIEDKMHTYWSKDWVGAGLYTTAEEFISEYKNYDGNLRKVAELYEARDMYIPASSSVECTFMHDVWGTDLDFAAYMQGEPECFINIHPAEVIKSNLTIRVMHGMSQGVNAREATEKYLKIADLYTAALSKYNVRVVLEWAGVSRNGSVDFTYKYEVELCGFGEVLSPLTLVSALSAPTYRAVMLGVCATFGATSCEWHPDQQAYLNKPAVIREGDSIIIPPIYNQSKSEWELENMMRAAGLTEEGA
jgi:hypothetical protein